MSRCYVFAHGAYCDGQEYVTLPEGYEENVRFYANVGQPVDALIGLASAHMDSHCQQISLPAAFGKVPNYYFSQLEDAHIQHILSLMNATNVDDPFTGVDRNSIQLLGLNLPSEMRLCGENGEGCAWGVHECDGLLGIFRRVPFDVIACRVESGYAESAGGSEKDGAALLGAPERVILDQWLLRLREEIAAGKQYSGDFVMWFDSLPKVTQAYLLTVNEIYVWRECRAAWTASGGFQSGTDLGRYLATDPGPLSTTKFLVEELSGENEITRSLGPEQTILAYGVHLFLSDPTGFAAYFESQSQWTQALLRQYPDIAAWSMRQDMAHLEEGLNRPRLSPRRRH